MLEHKDPSSNVSSGFSHTDVETWTRTVVTILAVLVYKIITYRPIGF